jgi:hypothetical protein
MKYVFLFLLTSLVFKAKAVTIQDKLVINKYWDSGSFVFQRVRGEIPPKLIKILSHEDGSELRASVIKCGPTACLAKLESGAIRPATTYQVQYETELMLADELKTSEVPKEKKNFGFLSYGSALGPALKSGYGRFLEDYFLTGATFSQVGSTIESTSLSGQLVTIFGRLEALPITESLKLFFLVELGAFTGNIKYKEGGQTDVMSSTSYVAAVVSELAYEAGDVVLSGKMGLSDSGIKDKHSFQGKTMTNPYGQPLLFVEIGAGLKF